MKKLIFFGILMCFLIGLFGCASNLAYRGVLKSVDPGGQTVTLEGGIVVYLTGYLLAYELGATYEIYKDKLGAYSIKKVEKGDKE